MKKKLTHAFVLNSKIYLEIFNLAQKHGKKAGSSMQAEFEKVFKKKRNKIKYLGSTDIDIDLLTGNMRESGLKILNLKELKKRKNNDKS